MLYKFEFKQYDHVPPDALERDKKGRMRAGMEEIGKAIILDYPYGERPDHDGKPIFAIELFVTSRKRYLHLFKSVERLLFYDVSAQAAVMDLLRELDAPDSTETREPV